MATINSDHSTKEFKKKIRSINIPFLIPLIIIHNSSSSTSNNIITSSNIKKYCVFCALEYINSVYRKFKRKKGGLGREGRSLEMLNEKQMGIPVIFCNYISFCQFYLQSIIIVRKSLPTITQQVFMYRYIH